MIERRRRANPTQTIFVVLAIVIVAVIIWQFTSFQDALARMPRGWTVAGASVAGLKPPEVILTLRSVYSQTLILRYRNETFTLEPAGVDFKLDEPATLLTLNAARAETGAGTRAFMYYLTQRVPPPREIPAVTTFSEARLRAFLAEVSQRYDQAPTSPAPLIEELRFVPGQTGSELDISASVPLIAAALPSATQREVNLAVKSIAPIRPKLKQLRDLLDAYVKRNFPGQAGVFIKDLQTGEEIGLGEAVAFSGLGLLKLPILVEAYRRINSPDAATQQFILQTATGEANNTAANALLQRIGDNDAFNGSDRVNSSLLYLGLVNTFIATPYDQNVKPPAIVTRANSRAAAGNTNPDARMQTTAEDMGLLLEMIYDCRRGGGSLTAAYGNAMTPAKCSSLIELLNQGAFADPAGGAPMYIRAGLPAGIRVADKWSWDRETRADAGIVFTPEGGDFVLVILLRQPNWGDWQLASPSMADITRATYNYFTLPR